MVIDLTGRVALVTGGSSGIGRETALLLAQAQATVIINYEASQTDNAASLEGDLKTDGLQADSFQADVSSPDEVDRLFQYIMKKYGRLDILVNNAGIVTDSLVLTTEPSAWAKVHAVNLRGAFLCTRHAAETMLQQASGKIVNVSSITARMGTGRLSTYASTKGGLLALTRSCAVELGKKNIQVNAVVPGFILTDFSKKAIKRAGDIILKRTPAGRFGASSEVAGLIGFLSSDHADYITGQALTIDGGMSIA